MNKNIKIAIIVVVAILALYIGWLLIDRQIQKKRLGGYTYTELAKKMRADWLKTWRHAIDKSIREDPNYMSKISEQAQIHGRTLEEQIQIQLDVHEANYLHPDATGWSVTWLNGYIQNLGLSREDEYVQKAIKAIGGGMG